MVEKQQQLEQQNEAALEREIEMLRLFHQGKATVKQLADVYEVTEEQMTQMLAEMNSDSEEDASTNHA